MPARNVKKLYVENAYYHLYNRGALSSPLFHDSDDYYLMLHLLKKYLAPEAKINPKTNLANPANISDYIHLISFCLMPNHFHFLVYQTIPFGITLFTRRLLTSYAMYIINKYKRRGNIFEGKLRGVLVDSESYLLHLSRYIHRNPLKLLQRSDPLSNYQFSSYPYYLGIQHASWVITETILDYFQNARRGPLHKVSSYKEFVEQYEIDSQAMLGTLTLEDKDD